MPSPRKCPQCGALVQQTAARFCEFCGYELALPEPARAAPVSAPAPMPELAARFEALKRHPELPELLAHEPSVARHAARETFGILFMLAFVIVGIFILTRFMDSNAPTDFPIWIVPLIIVGVGMTLLIAKIGRTTRIGSAPLERELAFVVDKRTEITGSNDSTRTRYHATLERPDGRRTEFETDGRVSGQVARGDLGVAYTKAELLLDFRRLSG